MEQKKSGRGPTLGSVNINLLVFFRAVWETRNTTAAAEQLNASQPTVSAAINRLREQFDDPLFVWDGRQMKPTVRATEMAPEILDLLDRTEALLLGGHGGRGPGARSFTIASADFVFYQLSDMLGRELYEKYPRLRLSLVNFKPEMIHHLGSMEVDLALLPEEAAHSTGLKRSLIWEEDYLLVRSKDTPAPRNREEFMAAPRVRFSAHPHVLVDHEVLESDVLPEGPSIVTTISHTLIPSLVAGTDRLAFMTPSMLKAARVPESVVAEAPPFKTAPLRLTMAWHASRRNDPFHRMIRVLVENTFPAK